jgi:chitodextrinase
LVASTITTSSFTLNWAASTDNVGVTAYKVYRNDVLVATTTAPRPALTGLSPRTAYAVKVSAEDAARQRGYEPGTHGYHPWPPRR